MKLRCGRLFAAVVTLLVANAAYSQTAYVFNQAQFGTGPTPFSIVVGDFNRDGILDVAVANADSTNGNSVSVLLGKSDGSFATRIDYATGGAPYAVIATDLNSDGKLDLIVAEPNSNSVSVLIGNGDGTFQPHTDIPVGQGPRALVAGDFNSDGKTDLAIANQTDNTISILMGNGNGTFQLPASYALGTISPLSIAVGDFNQDGNLDLALADAGSGGFVTLKGNGDGTFQAAVFPAVQVPGCFGPIFNAVSLVAADFNRDGRLDLAVATTWGGYCSEDNVSILLGNGDGTFQSPTNYATIRFASAVIAVDLNGDLFPDLVVGSSYGDPRSLSVLINNGDGSFKPHTDYSAGFAPIAIAAGDFNRDGKIDLVTANDQDNNVVVLLGSGDGTFQPRADYPSGNSSQGITAADFNNDGNLDLVTADCGNNGISVLLGDGNGAFQRPLSYAAGQCPVGVAAGDFDGDGKLDVAVVNQTDSTVSVLLGNGNGTFQPHIDYALPAAPSAVAVADFNGDHKIDLAVLNDGLVSIFLGNGDGTFQARKDIVSGLTYSTSIAVADINGDGIIDIVATDASYSGNLVVLLGNGDGTFRIADHHTLPFSPNAVAIGDFNRDGKLDLAVSQGTAQGAVSILLGLGDGTFQTPMQFQTNHYPDSVAVADFNRDGILDLAVGGSSMSILLGNGDGTFQTHMDHLENSYALVTGDFDGDGRPDVAAATLSSVVSVFLNKPAFIAAPVPPSISSINPTTATQGQTISNFTVNGSNFDLSAKISFSVNGITVNSYTSRTSTQIVASITISATVATGPYDVTVTTSDGQNGTLSGALNVLPAPPPIPGPPPPPAGNGVPGSPNNPQGSTSEPISTGTGNYYYTHTDFVIPGSGLPLLLQRSYNTLDNYAGPLGTNWTHNYNVILSEDASLTVHIRWGDGHGETYTLNGSNYLPQPGVFSTLTYNIDGTFTLTQKNQTQYHFSQTGKLTSILDRNGNTTLLTYDPSGNLIQITDPAGRALNLTYDGLDRITQVTDPAGRTTSYQYSAANDLISVTDAAGGVTQFAYDANHHVTSIVQPTGRTLLQNAYDSAGRVVTQMNGRGATTMLAYDVPVIGSRTITDARGQQTIHTYDAGMRITKVTDAALGTTLFTYDSNNDRTSVTNSNGNTTSFTYDTNGNITGITDPLGNSISFTYDAKNDLLTATNAKGNTTSFAYDGNGNLTSIEDALGNQTTFSYGGFGELTSKTDARGNTSNFNYDSFGNLTRITDGIGNGTALNYDSISRLTSITDPNGHTAAATYDALSRLLSISDPLGDKTQFAYNAVGNLLKIIDANGNATTYAYDAANNLTSVTDALAHLTQYAYDGNNNHVSFTNARGKTTAYAFDALNRLATITDPLGFVTSYTYDHAGNVTSLTDANGRTNQFTYDALNRLTGIAYADGKSVSYAYDPDGNRTRMMDSHGTTTYGYDIVDRLTSVSNPGGTLVAYGYDAVGNRSSVAYPDGKLLTYAFDQDNRLSRVTDWLSRATNYSYDSASNLTQILYPTGARLNFNYDAANRLQQVVNTYQGSLGNPISSFTYLLDRVGNRLEMTDGSGKATVYGYDKLNELTSVTVGTSVTSFSYDAVGNRLTLTAPGTSIAYSYDSADRLLAASNTTFAYDRDGNEITEIPPNKKPIAFGYDAANRLVSVLGSKVNSTFSYDGDGNRISQSVGSGMYSYINDIATALPVVLQESGPDGNISYAYGLGALSESGPGFDYFYQYDGLGSVVGLTDPGSKLAGRYGYEAWGNTDTSIPDSQIGTKNKFRFTGEALDPGTQLYYLRARYYDPSVGRFINKDSFSGFLPWPITEQRYIYGNNCPVELTDPLGLFSVGTFFGGIGQMLHAVGAQVGEDIVKGAVAGYRAVDVNGDLSLIVPKVEGGIAEKLAGWKLASSIGNGIADFASTQVLQYVISNGGKTPVRNVPWLSTIAPVILPGGVGLFVSGSFFTGVPVAGETNEELLLPRPAELPLSGDIQTAGKLPLSVSAPSAPK